MLGKKRVLVACGTGIATSTVVATKVADACQKAGIPVEVIQCKAIEVPSYVAQGADLIVSTTILSQKFTVPVVNGLAYLTGIGADQVSEQIVQKLKGA
ncbi:MAG: PTS sugar transporter subunit IIB [Actinobacteria bacterium]|nr:PTS sugar transporter subunit IIB [Actinomycetota bacterium]